MIDSFVSKVVSEVMSTVPVPDMVEGKVSDVVSKEPIHAEPPLLEYENLRGKPFTAEYLDIPFNKTNPVFEKSNNDVLKVEKYVLDEIERRHWEPTLDSYKDVMSLIKSAVNIEKNTDSNTALERILIYVDSMNKKNTYEAKINKVLKDLSKSIKGDNYGA